MPRTIQFHLDENISNVIAEGLRRRYIDVTTTPEQALVSVSDEEQLAFCVSQGRVIFTSDADFLRLHHTGTNHAGIIYCHQGSRSIGDIIRTLVLVWECLELEEMKNHLEFI
jgi:predicted nuclease of predicted toxin-antitoxin system